jgi:hypothetical protein
MFRKPLVLAGAALLVALAVSSKAQAWGAYHVGYTHYSPYTGLHHYGYTEAYRGYGYGGYHYGGYGAYGRYPYGVYGDYGWPAYGGYSYGYGTGLYGYGAGCRAGFYRGW